MKILLIYYCGDSSQRITFENQPSNMRYQGTQGRLSKFRKLWIPISISVNSVRRDLCRIFHLFLTFSFPDLVIYLLSFDRLILDIIALLALKNWHDRQTTTDAKDTLIVKHNDLLSFFLICMSFDIP